MGSAEDRALIAETCTRMGWLADRREWDKLSEIFADRVLIDYTSLNGGQPATLRPADLVGAWSVTLGAFDATQHLIASHLVDIDGDTALCTANFQATHRLANPFGSPLWTLGGIYRFELVRSGDGWKIAAVVMTATWADGNKDLLALASAAR